MTMLKTGKQIITFALLTSLAGCASYNALSLSPLQENPAIFSSEPADLLVTWQAFDKLDSEIYLGRDLISEGYLPIQLMVKNNSEDAMYLSPENFSVAMAPVSKVAQKAHTSTIGRVVVWGTGGLLLWPLMIPAIYDGLRSAEANQALDKDYQEKALREQVIEPHTTFNAVMFLSKEHAKTPIEMFLVNQRTQEKIHFSELQSR